MKRKWNVLIWGGFATSLAAVFSYFAFFVYYPVTRDFPWANLLLFAVAGVMLGVGTYRAYKQPDRYRGKVASVILSLLSLGILAFFCLGIFDFARRLPGRDSALHIGQSAPDFTLTDTEGRPVSLAQLRQTHRAVLLIFYRGYW
jgi:hypothetical protein